LTLTSIAEAMKVLTEMRYHNLDVMLFSSYSRVLRVSCLLVFARETGVNADKPMAIAPKMEVDAVPLS
jgi:hypothetical protein